MRKKGQINQLMPIITALVGVALVLAVGFLIMAESKTQITTVEGIDCDGDFSDGNDTLACNATHDVIDAMEDIPGWLPIIIVTVIGVLLLGLVAMFKRMT